MFYIPSFFSCVAIFLEHGNKPSHKEPVDQDDSSSMSGVKCVKLDGDGSIPSVRAEENPAAPNPLLLPEDVQLRLCKVVDAAEIGVELQVYTRVQGFWVPSVLAATYRSIVERCGYLVKECILDIKTLCYVKKNLLEVCR